MPSYLPDDEYMNILFFGSLYFCLHLPLTVMNDEAHSPLGQLTNSALLNITSCDRLCSVCVRLLPRAD